MCMKLNIEARSCNHRYSGKAIGITYSECVSVPLGIEHAMRITRTVICSLPGSTNLSTLSHKRHDCRKNVIEHKMCVLIFFTTSV